MLYQKNIGTIGWCTNSLPKNICTPGWCINSLPKKKIGKILDRLFKKAI